MEPADQSGTTGQTSPRGNDWEVVQLTASNYASSPGPARSEPSDEEQEYGTKTDDSAGAALLMSGHFSVPQNEAGMRQEARASQYAVSDEADDGRNEEKLKDESLPSGETESDDSNALQQESLAGQDPVTFSSSGYSEPEGTEKEFSSSATESKTETKAEEPILQNLDPDTGSSEVVASGGESGPDGSGSGVPRNEWLRKQMISLYRSARESNKFWPVIVAGAALMGMAYFRRRWLRGKLQLKQVQLQPGSSKERINHAVPPLNRIKDILIAGNHPSPGPHGHARLS